jgi:hypothetical protein
MDVVVVVRRQVQWRPSLVVKYEFGVDLFEMLENCSTATQKWVSSWQTCHDDALIQCPS